MHNNKVRTNQQRVALTCRKNIFLLVNVALLVFLVQYVFLCLSTSLTAKSVEKSVNSPSMESHEIEQAHTFEETLQPYSSLNIWGAAWCVLVVGCLLFLRPALFPGRNTPGKVQHKGARPSLSGGDMKRKVLADKSFPCVSPQAKFVTNITLKTSDKPKPTSRDQATDIQTDFMATSPKPISHQQTEGTNRSKISPAIQTFTLGSMTKYHMKFKMKADYVRHVTECKQRMIGALRVQRNTLTSDLVTMTELVRALRLRLDDQRDANRNLLMHIERVASVINIGNECVTNSNSSMGSDGVSNNNNNNNNANISTSTCSYSNCDVNDYKYKIIRLKDSVLLRDTLPAVRILSSMYSAPQKVEFFFAVQTVRCV